LTQPRASCRSFAAGKLQSNNSVTFPISCTALIGAIQLKKTNLRKTGSTLTQEQNIIHLRALQPAFEREPTPGNAVVRRAKSRFSD